MQVKTLSGLIIALAAMVLSVVETYLHNDIQATAMLGLATAATTYLFGLHDTNN